jgi:hypothetical protein
VGRSIGCVILIATTVVDDCSLQSRSPDYEGDDYEQDRDPKPKVLEADPSFIVEYNYRYYEEYEFSQF